MNLKFPFGNRLIAVSAFTLLCTHSFGQTGFDFGVKGFMNSTSMVSVQDQAAGNELNIKDRFAVGGGVGAGYSVTKHVGVEIDFLYSPQGMSYTGDADLITQSDHARLCTNFKLLANYNNIPFTGGYTADVQLSYMKIPLLFRYNMKNTKRVYFSMFIGPQFDFLSSAKIKINGREASLAAEGLDTKGMYKKTVTEGVLGLGFGVNLSKNFVLTAHLRFDGGLGDAENKSATYTSSVGVVSSKVKYYDSDRGTNFNATGGAFIGISYKLLKKDRKEVVKTTKTTTTTKVKSKK